jgi:protein ImuA
MEQLAKKEIVRRLQQDILLWEGYKPPSSDKNNLIGLGSIESAFPNGIFPTAAIHEFMVNEPEHAAASGGFIAGLIQSIAKHGGACLWISASRTLFPPALKRFGLEPDQIIFIDVKRERDVLWVTEEALKCDGIVVAVSELSTLSFSESRRLQLAVEKSKATGFILRNSLKRFSATTSAARWMITPIQSQLEGNMPGVGFPRWKVELLKVKNGNAVTAMIEWTASGFKPVVEQASLFEFDLKKRRA